MSRLIRCLHSNFSLFSHELSTRDYSALVRVSSDSHPAKTQISLSDQYSLSALWIAEDPRVMPTDSEDSGQIVWIRWLLFGFAGRNCPKVRFLTFAKICDLFVLRFYSPVNPMRSC